MKNINFRRNESVLKGLEIQSKNKAKNQINWDRIIYFSILGIILLFLLKYAIGKFFFVEADGQVLFDNIEIRNTDDCRIIDLYVEEGDSVQIGDSLFSFLPDNDDETSGYGSAGFAMSQKHQGDVSWSEKEIFKVNEEIKVNTFLIVEKIKLKNIYAAELQRIRNEVMLDVLPRTKLDEQLSKINQLNFDIQSLKGKNQLLMASLNQLTGMIRDLGNTTNAKVAGGGAGDGDPYSGKRVFYSPLAGTITTVMKNEFEVALKSEEIMSIHKPNNVTIKGFFEQSDLKALKIGDRVDLEFPDGSEGRGIIKRFYFATYRLPEEFQKKYEPTTRSLAVDIYPETPADLNNWKAYWKMGVKISKSKF